MSVGALNATGGELFPIVSWSELSGTQQDAVLRRPPESNDPQTLQAVRRILDNVQQTGDAALRQYGSEFDAADLSEFRVTDEEIAAAVSSLQPKVRQAMLAAIRNVRCFHKPQTPEKIVVETVPGVQCQRIPQALQRVGLYVPAGTAPLPSAAIMLTVPALLAGCPDVIICTPPDRNGRANPLVLAAVALAGGTKVFKIGGAQAIAAMAYGTQTVPKVDKIFGPGNRFVTVAKQQVAQDPAGAAIDMPAGPSEVLVLADETANPLFVAADLLSQAEHGSDSQVLLVTTSTAVATATRTETLRLLETLPRRSIAEVALQQARCIVVRDVAEAIDVSNRYAPEHLILQCRDANDWLPTVRNAGSVFIGPWSPETIGDYCSGTNHVLPTNRYAKQYSGLGVESFMRFMTVQEASQTGLNSLANTAITLAEAESLDAHAMAVRLRLAGT